jgi:hypothetical protein
MMPAETNCSACGKTPAWVDEVLGEERHNTGRDSVMTVLHWSAAEVDDQGKQVRLLVYSHAAPAWRSGKVEMPATTQVRFVAFAVDSDGRRGSSMGGVA